MGEKWRVTVERWDPDNEDDGVGAWTEEAMLTAPREALARFAPGVVAEALGSTPYVAREISADSATIVSRFQTNNAGATFTPSEPAPDSDKPKRTRRTKAQIEADRLAAEQQGAAEVAVTNAGADAYPQTEADRIVDQVSAPEPFNPFAPK